MLWIFSEGSCRMSDAAILAAAGPTHPRANIKKNGFMAILFYARAPKGHFSKQNRAPVRWLGRSVGKATFARQKANVASWVGRGKLLKTVANVSG